MKSKIIKLFEISIKTKLVYICLIFILACIGFASITRSLFENFQKHQEQYRSSTHNLLEIGNLVTNFFEIQENGKQFLMRKDIGYLHTYQVQIDSFQFKLEQIVQLIKHKDDLLYLNSITTLLLEKKIILEELQQLFANKEVIDSLYNKISSRIEKEINKETSKVDANAIMLQDTVWQKNKTFGERLRDAFRSNKKRNADIAAINTIVVNDSVIEKTMKVNHLLDSLRFVLQKQQNQYITKIENIENELYALLNADLIITKDITHLLLQFHEEMLLNVISLGDEFEGKTQLALRWSLLVGAIASLFIIIFILLIYRNVKVIRKTNVALAVEKQKTEELMESRHQMLLSISHDIKTPLNALLGYLELWENENFSPEQFRELSTMQYSGKYIMALLNNLLEFTRLEQQKSQISKENIEIVPFVMEIMEMFQPLCIEKNNKLNYVIDVEHNPQILMDTLKLKQILVNLISNAVKYTAQGEINVHVKEVCEPVLTLKVKVSDTGKGIPKEKLSTLFDAFTRVEKNSSGIEGTGLGLFVVKGLVDLLGGEIDIETEESRGTTVTFSIPFEPVLEITKPVDLPLKSLMIWVIEDDATQLQVIVSMLKKLGHTVITSANKNQFVRVLNNMQQPPDFDVVFTDLEIGDFNGYEVLRKIKYYSNTPVICFSGTCTTSKAELQQTGFDDFLEKPFSMHQLEKILRNIIHQKTETDFFSLHTLNEMFDNDKETVLSLLKKFTTSLPYDIQKFETALADENLALIQQTAHRLLPFCKQINAREVVPILEKIELSKKEDDVCFNNLKEEVTLLIIKLKKLLLKIK